MITEIILGLLIAVAHYVSDRFCLICTTLKEQAISSIAGVSIVYIFLNLFPEFYKQASKENPFVYISVLIGFGLFYLVDKEIYQKVKHATNDIKLAHGMGLIVYYLVVGIALVKLLEIGFKEGLLFFIPVFIYAGLSTLSGHGIHGMYGPHYKVIAHLRFLQAAAVIVGVLIALFFTIPNFMLIFLIGLVAGILLYVIIRDILPKGKKGEPWLFLIGVIIYTTLIMILWYV